MSSKVCLQPCNCLLNVEGTVSRQASYVVHEDARPDHTVLGCNPALYNNVDEDIDFIMDYPVLTIEGCECKCASKLVKQKSGNLSETIMVKEILREEGVDISDEDPQQLTAVGEQAVKLISDRMALIIDDLLNDKDA